MRRYWTEDEYKIMYEMFADNYTDTICKILNRSYRSVCSQATLMGLKKSESFRKADLKNQAERLRVVGSKYRFKKGHTPTNKGQKMPQDIYDKVKKTMFKKGTLPPNTKYDGHERIGADGYVMVRTQQGKYELKHRLMWETAHGPVPRGYIVVFKDHNPMNMEMSNLELITRKEHMLRNTIHRFPPELKITIRLYNKLKKNINAKQN